MGGPSKLQQRVEAAFAPSPAPELLGTIPDEAPLLDPSPTGPSGQWQTPEGVDVALEEGPPPWEREAGGGVENSDAARYVTVPSSWTLRWINPRLLESQGWRYWKPVLASDPRVTVLVQELVAPDGNIRRGGGVGDILAYMPTTWVVARRKQHEADTAKLTQTAVDRQQELREQFRRSGGRLRMEEARHPTHTTAEGRSMRD